MLRSSFLQVLVQLHKAIPQFPKFDQQVVSKWLSVRQKASQKQALGFDKNINFTRRIREKQTRKKHSGDLKEENSSVLLRSTPGVSVRPLEPGAMLPKAMSKAWLGRLLLGWRRYSSHHLSSPSIILTALARAEKHSACSAKAGRNLGHVLVNTLDFINRLASNKRILTLRLLRS